MGETFVAPKSTNRINWRYSYCINTNRTKRCTTVWVELKRVHRTFLPGNEAQARMPCFG